jgi:hypothetical protein
MENKKIIKIRRLINNKEDSFITTSIVLAEDLSLSHHVLINHIKKILLKESGDYVKFLIDQHVYFFNNKELSFLLKNLFIEDIEIEYEYINIENSQHVGLLHLVIHNMMHKLDNTIDDVLAYQSHKKESNNKGEENKIEEEYDDDFLPGIKDVFSMANNIIKKAQEDIIKNRINKY